MPSSRRKSKEKGAKIPAGGLRVQLPLPNCPDPAAVDVQIPEKIPGARLAHTAQRAVGTATVLGEVVPQEIEPLAHGLAADRHSPLDFVKVFLIPQFIGRQVSTEA